MAVADQRASTFLGWRWRAPLRPLTLTLTRQNPNPL
jgi:hypothetical protein